MLFKDNLKAYMGSSTDSKPTQSNVLHIGDTLREVDTNDFYELTSNGWEKDEAKDVWEKIYNLHDLSTLKSETCLHELSVCGYDPNSATRMTDPFYDPQDHVLYYQNEINISGVGKTRCIRKVDMSERYPKSDDTFGSGLCDYFNGCTFTVTGNTPLIRDMVRYGNYLLVVVRASSGNMPSDGYDNNSIWGWVFCIDITTFSVVWRKSYNAKLTGISIFTYNNTTYFAISGQMSYMIFGVLTSTDLSSNDIDTPSPHFVEKTRIYTYRYHSADSSALPYISDSGNIITEFHHSQFCLTSNNDVLCIVSGFSDGIHIFRLNTIPSLSDSTDYDLATQSVHFWTGEYNDWKDLNYLSNAVTNTRNEPPYLTDPSDWVWTQQGYHFFSLEVNFPYIYATLAPSSDVLNQDYNDTISVTSLYDSQKYTFTFKNEDWYNARGGIFVIDISDIINHGANIRQAESSIQANGRKFLIPTKDLSHVRLSDDTSPKSIVRINNKLFLNNEKNGIIVFDITDPSEPKYLGLKHNDNILCSYALLNKTDDGNLIACESQAGSTGHAWYKRNKPIVIFGVD